MNRPADDEASRMKNAIAFLAAAALTAACAQKIDPNEVRSALPQASAVQIGTPQGTGGSALTVAEVGTASEYAAASYWTALTFNGATWWILTVVHVITLFPPTSCTDTSCTWGPWLDQAKGATYRLDVSKSGDGYDYVLAGHGDGSADFLPLVSGKAFPGSAPSRGNGDFTVNFENGRTIDPTSNDHGTLDVSYDNRASLQIGAVFLGARNDDPANPGSQYIDIAYQFGAAATGGELQVAFQTTDHVKNLSLRTRWADGGQGRGDAKYTESTEQVEASQCWPGVTAGGGAWQTVYERMQSGLDVVETGDIAGCGAFSDPVYSTLVLP